METLASPRTPFFKPSTKSPDFVWWPSLEMGWDPTPKDDPDFYWDEYQKRQTSEMASALMDLRRRLVDSYHTGPLVDVGIGSGQFLLSRPDTRGHDAGERACAWLRERGLWWQASDGEVPAMSFWDSLEHLVTPSNLLSKVTDYIFVTVPVSDSLQGVMSSKHFKPREHYWYFTRKGFVGWMNRYGFALMEHNQMEQSLGRESVDTYVFQRA